MDGLNKFTYKIISEMIHDQLYESIFEEVFGSCIKSVEDEKSELEYRNEQCKIGDFKTRFNLDMKMINKYKKRSRMKQYIYKDRRIVRGSRVGLLVNRRFHDYLTVYPPKVMSFHFNYPTSDVQKNLEEIAAKIVAPGKGILSIDESLRRMTNTFQEIGINNSLEYRQKYFELLLTTDTIIGEYISGVLIYPETFYQQSSEGVPFIELLNERNILIGVIVDKGTVPLICSEDEYTVQGLDDLDPRCGMYKKDGCHFANWCSVFRIGKNTPSPQALYDNANVLARYSSICQAHAIVPVLETKIIPHGDHSLLQTQNVTEQILAALHKALSDHHVYIEGIILKIRICTPGKQCLDKATPEEAVAATLIALQRTVPAAVAGITICSIDQTKTESTCTLETFSKMNTRKPWPITFSYGRDLHTAVLRTWLGIPDKVKEAQDELIKHVKSKSISIMNPETELFIAELAGSSYLVNIH